MKFKIKVKNIGGSRAIIIPAAIARGEGIEFDDTVEIEIKKVPD